MARRRRGKVCSFCVNNEQIVDYKNVSRLQEFLTDAGKILPRRITGTCARHQRQLTKAIKKARQVALLPYVSE